jgi:hypothetical protein
VRTRPLALLVVFALLGPSCARPKPSLVPLSVGTETEPERRAPAAVDRRAPAEAEKVPEPEEAAEAAETNEAQDPARADAPKQDAESKTSSDEKDRAGESKGALVRWDGEYAGEDVATYRFGGTERVEKDPKARTRVHDQARDSVKLTLVNSANGNDLCTLTGKLQGHTATLEAGQDCFSTAEGAVSARGTVQSGTATIKDDTLTIETTLSYEVSAEGQVQSGELSYRFEGRRNGR